MAKGAAIKFTGYKESVPKLLKLLRLDQEIKKYDSIVLKVQLSDDEEISTPLELAESALSFILENKNPVANVFIAEGSDGSDTETLYESRGFHDLAEGYGIGLIDLNTAETEPIESQKFSKFEVIYYPKILKKSFVISLTKLAENSETTLNGSLSSMLGTFPAKHYQGFFSSQKNKIRKFPLKYSIYDILQCKSPDFAIIDASSNQQILAGLPEDMDKQSAKILGLDWNEVPYLKLLEESKQEIKEEDEKSEEDEINDLIGLK